jgi:hypothetical protein
LIIFDFTKYSDADPDPNFHVDADLDQDPDWHQNNADPHAVPTPCFTDVRKFDFFYFWSQYCHLTMFLFSVKSNVSHFFSTSILDTVAYEIFCKKVYFTVYQR